MSKRANRHDDTEEAEIEEARTRPSCPLTTDLGSTTELDDFQSDTPELDNPRYALCQELQRGGMGIIFVANDRQLPREVAIKILRQEFAAIPKPFADSPMKLG